MAPYVTLLKFTSEGLKSIGDFGKGWEEGVKRTAQMGIKTIGAYGLLGGLRIELRGGGSEEANPSNRCCSSTYRLSFAAAY